jgi:hypothetical protein
MANKACAAGAKIFSVNPIGRSFPQKLSEIILV